VRNEYELQLERRAKKDIEGIPDTYERVEDAIESLAHEPRPPGCLKMRGPAPLWRIRIGEYRIIYAVFDRERIVKVARVVRRTGQTYERM